MVEPIVNPVTIPELETDATAGFEDVQGLLEAAVVVAVIVIVSPAPTEVGP